MGAQESTPTGKPEGDADQIAAPASTSNHVPSACKCQTIEIDRSKTQPPSKATIDRYKMKRDLKDLAEILIKPTGKYRNLESIIQPFMPLEPSVRDRHDSTGTGARCAGCHGVCG